MKKTLKKVMVFAAVAVFCLTALTGCGNGGNANTAPTNLTFDTSSGAFSFDAVKNAETYTVGVSQILNDTTGQALLNINGAAATTIEEGNTVYLWSEQTGSVSGLADNDGDSVVDGTVVFREYSSSANTVGQVISIDQLPLGHYVVTAIASSNDSLPNPEPAYFQFTMGGTLAEPSGFTAQINDAGNIEITAPSNYYLNCLTATGLPSKMRFEVKDGDSVVDTIELEDFSYTNSVNGPNKGFTFNNQTVIGTAALDGSKEYTVTVTAVGDGDQILDASANAYVASNSASVTFAQQVDTSGSGNAGDYSVSLTMGTDASGNTIYELTASVNNVVILRENGTFTATEEVGEYEEKYTYPEGAQLTFTAENSDFDTAVLEGVTLTVARGEAMMFGPPGMGGGGATFYVEGSANLNGTTFDFAQSSGGFPGMPF